MDTGQSTIHTRGYFGIGIYGAKYGSNVGTLWRSAHLMQAGFIFTIGRRYTPVPSDTHKSWRQVPLFEYDTFDQFRAALPKGARLVGVELTGRSIPLPEYTHPACAVYLLGAEDHGLPQEVLRQTGQGNHARTATRPARVNARPAPPPTGQTAHDASPDRVRPCGQ